MKISNWSQTILACVLSTPPPQKICLGRGSKKRWKLRFYPNFATPPKPHQSLDTKILGEKNKNNNCKLFPSSQNLV